MGVIAKGRMNLENFKGWELLRLENPGEFDRVTKADGTRHIREKRERERERKRKSNESSKSLKFHPAFGTLEILKE